MNSVTRWTGAIKNLYISGPTAYRHVSNLLIM